MKEISVSGRADGGGSKMFAFAGKEEVVVYSGVTEMMRMKINDLECGHFSPSVNQQGPVADVDVGTFQARWATDDRGTLVRVDTFDRLEFWMEFLVESATKVRDEHRALTSLNR